MNNIQDISDVKKIKALAVVKAIGYIGQQEIPKGSNWGPFVQECLKGVGIGFAAPWCMAFVHRCFAEAAAELGYPCPVHKTGGVLECWNKFDQGDLFLKATAFAPIKMDKAECLRHPELIMPGDQFFFKEGPTIGHTGIIERVEGLLLHTIEGNTNTDGSREGYEVERKIRKLSSPILLGVVRY